MTIDKAYVQHINTVALNNGRPMSEDEFRKFAAGLRLFYNQWNADERDIDAIIHSGALKIARTY